MRRFTLREIASRFHTPIHQDRAIKGYEVDSRKIAPGQLFFALEGKRVDGHAFLEQVAASQAIGAVVSDAYRGRDHGLPLIRVRDVLRALQDLAQDSLVGTRSIIVAVTGSVGKTTTKEFLRTLLSQHYHVAASPGNSNSQIGLPLALLNHTDGTEEILILEMGMTSPGHLARLVEMAPPDIALITAVELAHACNFDHLEAIGCAKAEIFSSPKTRVGLLPREVSHFETLCAVGSCRKKSFSVRRSDADYTLQVDSAGCLTVLTAGERQEIGSWRLPGGHNQHNLLAAIAVARELKVSWREIVAAIPHLSLPERRLQMVERHGICFINDSYNAHPIAVKAALESLPSPKPPGQRIAVLASMPELGKFSQECHREVGECALRCVEQMFCLGEECEPIYEVWRKKGRAVSWFLDKNHLVTALKASLRAGDVVLIKGANATQMWTLLEEWE